MYFQIFQDFLDYSKWQIIVHLWIQHSLSPIDALKFKILFYPWISVDHVNVIIIFNQNIASELRHAQFLFSRLLSKNKTTAKIKVIRVVLADLFHTKEQVQALYVPSKSLEGVWCFFHLDLKDQLHLLQWANSKQGKILLKASNFYLNQFLFWSSI